MFEVFKAFGTLAINGMDAVQEGLARFERKGRQAAATLDRIGNATARAGRDLTKYVTGTIAATIGALTALSLRTLNYVGSLRTMGREINTSVRDLNRLQIAFRDVLTGDQAVNVIRTLNDGVNSFLANGGGALQQFFDETGRRFGVTAENFSRLGRPEQLQLLFRTLERASRGTADFQARVAALGPEFAALLPIYRQGPDAFREAFEGAANAPDALSDRLIALSERWEATWGGLTRRMTGLNNTVSEATIPVMIRLVEIFEERLIPILEQGAGYLGEMGVWFSSLSASAQEQIIMWGAIAAAVGPVLLIFAGIIKVVAFVVSAFATLAGAIAFLVSGPIALFVAVATASYIAFSKLFELFPRLIPGIISLFRQIGQAAANDWNRIVYVAQAAWAGVVAAWNAGVASVQAIWNALDNFFKNTLPNTISDWANWGRDIYNAFTEWLSRLPDTVGRFISDMADRAVARVRAMAASIRESLSSLYNAVVGNSIIPDMATEVVQEISGMADQSIRETERMKKGVEGAMPRTGLDTPAGAGSGAGGFHFDMRHAIFRDDRDLLDRMRLSGADPVGVF